jgi:hypothetical protein
MAYRSGQFGRAPRTVPSLTNTLVSIANQFITQQDQNIMSAWQKGGTYEGQPVTDAIMLQHWQDRMKGLSTNDPMYDNYKLAYTQLQYTIGESKMTALYSQKKATDAQMIAFYLGEAKKIPVNSEFYRVLQRDAGQYMRNAQSGALAAAAAAKEKAYNISMADLQKKNEDPATFLANTIQRMDQSGVPGAGLGAILDAPGSNSSFTNLASPSAAEYMQLLSLITPTNPIHGRTSAANAAAHDAGNVGSANVLYHNDNGKPVTGAMIYAQWQKLVPGFHGPINSATLSTYIGRAITGIDQRIALAQKTGHMTAVSQLNTLKAQYAEVGRVTSSIPVVNLYMQANAAYMKVMNDSTSTSQDFLAAKAVYDAALGKLASDPRIATNDNLKSRLTSEINGGPGTTVAQDLTGLSSASSVDQTGAAKVAAKLDLAQKQIDAVATSGGAIVWTNGLYTRDASTGVYSFHADPTGDAIGAATQSDIASGGGVGATIVYRPDPAGGAAIPVTMTGVGVYADAKDSATGATLNPTDLKPIATRYDYPNGAPPLYGFLVKDASGKSVMVYSSDGPFGSSNPITKGTGGWHVDISSGQPVNPDLSKNGDLGNGWAVSGAVAATATSLAKPGSIIFTPIAAAGSTNTRTGTGGYDPQTDFVSQSLAHLHSLPEGSAELAKLENDSVFMHQIDIENHVAAGGTYNASTGTWTGVDANALAQYTTQTTNIISPPPAHITGSPVWQRTNTGSPFPSGLPSTVPTAGNPSGTVGGWDSGARQLNTLPLDYIRNSPLGAMASGHVPGTNNLAMPFQSAGAGTAIKLGTQFTLPTFSPAQLPGGTAPAPVKAVTPPPTVVTGQSPWSLSGGKTGAAPPPTSTGGIGMREL